MSPRLWIYSLRTVNSSNHSFTAALQSWLGRTTKMMLKQHPFLESLRKEILQPLMNYVDGIRIHIDVHELLRVLFEEF